MSPPPPGSWRPPGQGQCHHNQYLSTHTAAALTWEVVQLAVVVVAEAGVGGGHQEAGGGAIRGGVPARVQLLPEPGYLQVAAEAGLAQHSTVSVSVLSPRCSPGW